ncbi:unnamed protein product [Brassicogethes aeneus]|uniref:Transposase n=1 Tax=Brassicogethes aeneus TaxID=1431903 RepID=A0A9P0AW17_BRAAE|nr:unnamed protein product [Brassicogethes aeneus]
MRMTSKCFRSCALLSRPTPGRKSFVALCTNLATYGSFKKETVPRRKRDTTDKNVALVLQSRRLNFLTHFRILLEENPNLLNQILWSDESRFNNNEVINKHNCRYWSQENPNWIRQTKFQTRFGVNVWCGIVNGYIVGPYLYHEHLTSVRYLQFMQNDLPLLLQNLGIDVNTMWFHQDGAAAPNSNIVMNHLNAVSSKSDQHKWGS